MRRVAVVAIVSAALSAGAFQSVSAADMPVKAPVRKVAPAPLAYSWTGFYVGGHCGAGWGRTVARTFDDEDIFDNKLSPNGGFCGGPDIIGSRAGWCSVLKVTLDIFG
jgi:hypothetical protein